VTVAGFGGRGIERLSLRIVDAVGRTVAETGADGRDAFVQACSEHPVDWSVVVMAAEGGGVIQYLRLDGDPMLVPNRSSLWYGERRRVEVHDSEARLRGLLAVLGLRQSRSVSRERLQHGEVRASEHTIRGGPCVAVLGTATQGAPLAIGISRGGVAGSIPPRQSGNPVALQLWCDGRESRRVRVELAAPLAAVDAVITIATGENPLGGESSAQSLLDAFADELAEGWRLIPELHRRVEGSGEEAIAWPDGEGCVRARWVGEEGTRATLSTQVEAEDDARDIGPDARITRCAAPRPDALSLQLQEIAEAGGWLLWLRPEAEPPTRRR